LNRGVPLSMCVEAMDTSSFPYVPSGSYQIYPKGPVVSNVSIQHDDEGVPVKVVAGKVVDLKFSSPVKTVSRLFFAKSSEDCQFVVRPGANASHDVVVADQNSGTEISFNFTQVTVTEATQFRLCAVSTISGVGFIDYSKIVVNVVDETESPTRFPTKSPTPAPTKAPQTKSPSFAPTQSPSPFPTIAPTVEGGTFKPTPSPTSAPEPVYICQGNSFGMGCQSGQRIQVIEALYGRFDAADIPDNLSCKREGRQKCTTSVKIPVVEFKTHKTYFEVTDEILNIHSNPNSDFVLPSEVEEDLTQPCVGSVKMLKITAQCV